MLCREVFWKMKSLRKRETRDIVLGKTFDFILWVGTGRKGEEFTDEDITCEFTDKYVGLPTELKEIAEEFILSPTMIPVLDRHPSPPNLNVVTVLPEPIIWYVLSIDLEESSRT